MVGDYLRDGRYLNLDGRPIPPPGALKRHLRWRLSARAEPELPDATDEPAWPVAPDPRSLAAPPALQTTWLGHATALIQLDGVCVLTDPVFGAIAPLGSVRRLAPAPIAIDALPAIDAILVSHNHYDHCDLPTLRALRRAHPAAVVLVPAGLDDWLRRRIGDPVAPIAWWSHHRLGGLRVHAVPAQHWSVRGPRDQCRSHWCGFVVEGPSGVVYFAGDTGFGPHFEAIAERHPTIDAALLPIGAYAPRWFMADQHMGPQEAIEAADILDAPIVAIHWGTYRLTDEPADEPPRLARAAAEAVNRALTVLHPGGWWRPDGTYGEWRVRAPGDPEPGPPSHRRGWPRAPRP